MKAAIAKTIAGLKLTLRQRGVLMLCADLLGLTEHGHLANLVQQAHDYAWYYADHTEAIAAAMLNNTAYWQWYINEALLRDEVYLKVYGEYNGIGAEQELFEYWLESHDKHRLKCRPGRLLTQQALQSITVKA